MTITVDWQVELNGLTIGAGTDYPITGPITGLGIPAPRTADQERGNSPGDVAGRDIAARRVLTVPHGVGATDDTTPAEAWQLYETLKQAWSTTPVDVAFDLRLPGFSGLARRFYGRPRGLDDDLSLLRDGWVAVLGTFEALDPYAYGPETEAVLVGSSVVTSPGSAPSDRYTLVIEPTGPTVTLSNETDDEPALVIADVTDTLIVDGRTRSIVDDSGLDVHPAAGSGWPVIESGVNPLTVTGGTAALTYRPAYL